MIDLEQALSLLKEGRLVVLPTDTVYGLAADFGNEDAVNKIFELKGRPPNKPLAVLVDSIEMVRGLVDEITDAHKLLMEKFWPGALTLIFTKSNRVPELITAGQRTIGLRMPNCEATLKVIQGLGRPVVATSVNLSGEKSVNDPKEMAKVFPSLKILQNDQVLAQVESTVLDVTTGVPVILRKGQIKKEQIEEVLGKPVLGSD